MKLNRLFAGMVFLLLAAPAWSACSDLYFDFLSDKCNKGFEAYDHGSPTLLLSGYSYHLRSTYDAEHLAKLNEEAWGLGYAKAIDDAKTDWHALYGLAFRDSHDNIQAMVGYGWQTYWGPPAGLKVGAGLTAFIVSRPDIANGIPVPGILPLLSVRYDRAQLLIAPIPKVSQGTTGNGNVIFFFGSYRF
jgi:palmitoyl transferase